MLMLLLASLLLGLNLLGGKAIAVYVVIILAAVAFGVYSRNNASRR